MDQTQDPNPAGDKKNEIDLDRILLPKKEVHTSASAQRVNASVLLEQEVRAGAPDPALPQKPKESAGAEALKPEESSVKQLQTYQRDIERLVQNKNVSVLSIAAAEAKRRASQPLGQEPEDAPLADGSSFLKIATIAGGTVLLAAAAGLFAFVFLRQEPTPVQTATITAPFISVDDTQIITITPEQSSRLAVLQTLEAAKKAVHLPLGLVERLHLTVQTAANAPSPLSAQTILGLLAPGIPQEFLRTVAPAFLLGVHSFDQNQLFLILGTDSYQGGYAGMLAWEITMQSDLSPLFDYTPSPHLTSGNTATTSATSTPFVQKGFVDSVVENRNARIIQNADGDILLLWTFLDRETILITTNEYTLREIVSRVRKAPALPAS